MNDISQIVIRRRLRRRFPAGTVAGLLAGCLATLIGIGSGIDPFAICIRATVSGLVVGTAAALGAAVIRIANLEPETAGASGGRLSSPARRSGLAGPR